MQKCRHLSFLHTSMTALHHGIWLGQIVPASNIFFTCARTSANIGGGILQNFSLKGSSSMTLISCFVKSVQPNSPGSREKMLWYSTNRAQVATWFLSDHLSRPDKLSYWKSNFFLCSTVILVCWISCILSNFSRVLGVSFTGGTTFTATTWVTLMPLVMVIETAVRFFTTTTIHLLPEITLCVHHTQAMRQVGSITPFQGLNHYMHIVSQEQSFHLAMYYFRWKSIHFFLLGWFDHLLQVGWIHSLVCDHLLLNQSSACWQANNGAILDPFRETNSSLISLSLITLMMQLMVGVSKVTGTWDLNQVESGMTRATWSSS